MLTCRVGSIGIFLGLVVSLAHAQAPAEPKDELSSSEKAITRMEEYYARIYSEPLKGEARLPSIIAIVSLSRIDAPSITEALMGTLEERDTVVRYLAWEALHARHTTLSPRQRELWLTAGLRTAADGGFPGHTVTPLLKAAIELPAADHADAIVKTLERAISENSPDDPKGTLALEAARDAVAAWGDPTVVRRLAAAMRKPDNADRVALVLSDLPGAPAAGEASPAAWQAFAASFKPDAAPQPIRYGGKATAFASPQKITDPHDPRWRAELEIGKLTITDLDLAWVIDATGSMAKANQLVADKTGTVMRVLSLVSRQTRCGAIYVRHEVVQGIMQPCCERATKTRGAYQVKRHTLTHDVAKLIEAMRSEEILPPNQAPGNVHPGTAVHGGIYSAVAGMPWSKDASARRIIMLVGDAEPTPNTLPAAEKLAAEAVKNGYQVHALATRQAIKTWPTILQAAQGELIAFSDKAPNQAARGGAARRAQQRQLDDDPVDPFERTVTTILHALVAEEYRDRVDSVAPILIAYAQAAEPAPQ